MAVVSSTTAGCAVDGAGDGAAAVGVGVGAGAAWRACGVQAAVTIASATSARDDIGCMGRGMRVSRTNREAAAPTALPPARTGGWSQDRSPAARGTTVAGIERLILRPGARLPFIRVVVREL